MLTWFLRFVFRLDLFWIMLLDRLGNFYILEFDLLLLFLQVCRVIISILSFTAFDVSHQKYLQTLKLIAFIEINIF